MEKTMTREDAVQLVEEIIVSVDSGNWYVHVAAIAHGYAVAVRQHNTSTSYYVSSFREFIALCDQLVRPGR